MKKKIIIVVIVLLIVLRYFNITDMLWPRSYYKFSLAYYNVNGYDLSDPNYMLRSSNDLINHAKEIAEARKVVSENYDEDIFNMVLKYGSDMLAAPGRGAGTRLVRNLADALIGHGTYVEAGQVTRKNLGLDGVYTLEEGTYGVEGLKNWLDIAQNLKNIGYSNDEIECYITTKIHEYYGDYSNRAGHASKSICEKAISTPQN